MNLNTLTIIEAIKGLRAKEFSSVELTQACLDQIKKLNPKLNSFITVTSELALESAKKADERLAQGQNEPLLGIPIALKDLFSTKGIETTAGSNLLRGYIPPFDATVTAKLKSAGAIIVGKTNLDAWAHGSSGENSDFGSTKNPWNTDYVPGGSSSGSAVSVSADMCLASTGTDTGGSIRLPASFTNTVGLKPTYGRVSRYGVVAMASSLDSIGHFTKTVQDSALMFSVTAGNDPKDATSSKNTLKPYQNFISHDLGTLRIGVPKEYFSEGLSPEIEKITKDAINTLERLGAKIIEISLPHTKYANACYYIIQPAEVSSNLGRYDGIRFGSDRAQFGEEAKRRIMLGTYTLSSGYYDAYYKKAMRVRTLIKQDFDQAFTQVDAIIAPASPTPAWKLGEKTSDPLAMYLSDIFTVTANLAGIPGLCVPAGLTTNKVPVGIQLLGPQFSENTLFQIGHAYEQETQFYKQKPNL